MRKLNVRFFLLLLASILVLTGGLYGVHRFQRDRIGRALLWQAERAAGDGTTEKAVQYYARYLDFQPNDNAAKVALGEILEQQLEKQPPGHRNPSQVIYLFEDVLQTDGSREDLRRRVVAMYMLPRMRRYGDALTHLNVLLENHPDDGALWQLKAICQEGEAKYEAAADSFAKALQFPPDQARSFELLARLLRKHLSRHKQADETIERMVERHPATHEAYLARARYRLEFNLGDIAADADTAYALAPENAEAILLAARVEQQRNHVPQAIELLEKGNRLYPSDARFYRHAAWICYFQKKNELARKWLQDGIVACPEAFDLHTALAELLIQGKMFDQVQKIVADLKAKGVREERIRYLTARIAIEREQWPDAVGILERLRTESRGNPELSVQLNLLLAHCQKQLGDADRQFESLRRVLEHDAGNVTARQALGALHASAGRFDDAVKEYQQLLNLPNAPDTAATDLARLMITRKLRLPPEKQNWQDVEQLLAQIAQRQPSSTELLLAKSDLLAAQKKTPEAAELLAKARTGSKDLRLWLQAAHYAEQADGSGPAVLDEAEKVFGDLVELRLKRAALLLGRSHAELLRGLPALERPAPSFTPEQVNQLRVGLAELSFLVHDYAAARRLFKQLADDRPGDMASRLMLAEIALRERDKDALPKLLADVRQIEPPGGNVAPLLEARFSILRAEDGNKASAEKARTALQSLLQKRAGWALIHQSLARLAEVDGDRTKAIEHYRRAIELGDADLRSHCRLVRLLVDAHQEKAAEQVLRQVQERGSLAPERQRQMLQTVLPLVSGATMQNIVAQTVSKDSTDPQDHIWLGKMLWDTGDRPKALEEFRTATAQAGKVPQNWITLVQALTANNQLDEAKKAIEDARRELPPDRAGATIAACLEITRQFEEATAEYAKAFREKPRDSQLLRGYARLLLSLGKTREVTTVFQFVIDKPEGFAQDDVTWARRNLAIVGTAEGNPEQFRRAFDLLKQNESELGETLEDLRARVVVLAHMPPGGGGPPPRRQAIAILEKALKHPQAGVEDRFSLAKLYDAEHDWAKAEEQYRAVLAAEPRNAAAWTHFTRRLLQRDKLDAADEPLRELERLAPQAAATAALRARWHFQRGETDKLLAHLKNYVNQIDAKSAEAFDRAYVAATLFDEFARTTAPAAGRADGSQSLRVAALQMYQQALPRRRVDATVHAAALLSHFGGLDKTLTWLEQPEIAKDANLKASALLAALRAGHADESKCREAENWLRDLASRHASVDLDLQLADLMELQHRFDEAEKLYRKVLQSNPNHIVALNNLAWVIAHRKPSGEALELIHRATMIAGPLTDLLDTRAKVYLSLGRAPEAVQDLEDAINEAPTAMRYFQLALAQEINANPEAAKLAFAQARHYGIDVRDLHPDDAKGYAKLSQNHG